MAKKSRKHSKPRTAPRAAAPQTRWSRHRPLLERLVFIVALCGVLVTAHMTIWWANYNEAAGGAIGSECGIPGVAGSEASAFDCAAAFSSGAGTFLGVSNAVWGLLFYLAVVGLSLLVAFGGLQGRTRWKQMRALLIGAGALYTVYLTIYQFVVLPKACLLCLISAAFVLILAALTAVYHFGQEEEKAHREPAAAPSTALYAGLGVLLLVLVGADFVYFESQEVPAAVANADHIVPAREIDEASMCRFDEGYPVYSNIELLIDENDYVEGNPDAEVTVIEFFDPNCPACKAAFPIVNTAVQRYGDRARFVFKPVGILGQASMQQVAAMEFAAEGGKFHEMMAYQFDNQQRGGLPISDLADYADDLGLDGDALTQALRSGQTYNETRRQTQLFRDMGLRGVPSILIDGRVLSSNSRYVECIGYFIDQALQDETAPEEAPAEPTAEAEG